MNFTQYSSKNVRSLLYLSSYSADIITKEENVAETLYIRLRVEQTSDFIAAVPYQSTLTPPVLIYHWLTHTSL